MILLTGFEPFGGEGSNPSWDAVKALPGTMGGQRIERLRLPVTYGECFTPVREAMRDTECRAVICVGQAGGRTAITPEGVAINRMHASLADQQERIMQHEPILLDGVSAYFSTFPVQAMVDRMCAAEIPAAVSYHAGTYVCNNLLYLLMHSIHAEALPVLGGFIHVPYSSEQVCVKNVQAASLPLSMIVEGLRLCVEETAKVLEATSTSLGGAV